MRFAGTYYFVYIIDKLVARGGVINDSFFDHFTDSLSVYAAPFQRWTALHIYIEFILRQILNDDFLRASGVSYIPKGKCSSTYCTAGRAHLLAIDLMRAHGLELPDLATELDEWVEAGCRACPTPVKEPGTAGPDFDMWEEQLDSEYDALLEAITEELFFVLFANRTFLYRFNASMAGLLGHSGAHAWAEDAELFQEGGDDSTRLRRVGIPEWAKRAVFFRDRGRCCTCERDLGAGYSPEKHAQYDHMVPLASSGLNDVTNLQLLCKTCNNRKRHNTVESSRMYDRWYSADYEMQPRSYPTLERVILGLMQDDG